MTRLLANPRFLFGIAVIAVIAALALARGRHRQFGPLPEITPVNRSAAEADGNFYLYVSQRSFQPEVIDLRISIDGVDVVRDKFKHDLIVSDTRYRLSIEPGEHVLVAETIRGQARLEETIRVGKETHVGIAYYYSEAPIWGTESPPTITCYSQGEPWIPDWAWKESE